MMIVTRVNTLLGATALILALCVPAHAMSTTRMMDFEGIPEKDIVGNFYNGGGGPDFGVSFSPNVFGVTDSAIGTTGNVGGDREPDTAIHFRFGPSMTVNVEDGFRKGLNFYYSARVLTQLVVYNDVDATGDVIASMFLPTATFGTGEFGGFGRVIHMGLGGFEGQIARSFKFISDEPTSIVIDKLEIGKAYPEPVTGVLGLMGVGAIGGAMGRRRRKA